MTTITALPISSCMMDGDNTHSVPITPATNRAGLNERIFAELTSIWLPDCDYDQSKEAIQKAIDELLANTREFPFENTFPHLSLPDGYVVIEHSPTSCLLYSGYTDGDGVFMPYGAPSRHTHRSRAIWDAITSTDDAEIDDMMEFYNFTVSP